MAFNKSNEDRKANRICVIANKTFITQEGKQLQWVMVESGSWSVNFDGSLTDGLRNSFTVSLLIPTILEII